MARPGAAGSGRRLGLCPKWTCRAPTARGAPGRPRTAEAPGRTRTTRGAGKVTNGPRWAWHDTNAPRRTWQDTNGPRRAWHTTNDQGRLSRARLVAGLADHDPPEAAAANASASQTAPSSARAALAEFRSRTHPPGRPHSRRRTVPAPQSHARLKPRAGRCPPCSVTPASNHGRAGTRRRSNLHRSPSNPLKPPRPGGPACSSGTKPAPAPRPS